MKKTVMAKLDKCYSIAPLVYHGKQHILVAAEKHDRCILFNGAGKEEATLWSEPGGVMTMCQVPGTDGQFMATHQFYSPNDSKNAKLILATPCGDHQWEIKTLMDLPFVHRFDILQSGGENYLIACTLKSDHEYKEDWRTPGKVYGAKLPKDLSQPIELKVLKDNMLRNHGYYRVIEDGKMSSLVGSDNGAFRFYPPETDGGEWKIEQLLDTPTSDMALIDLDGDGEMELLAYSPFHGDEVAVYKKKDGKFERVYTYPEKAEFIHAIWVGKLAGKSVAVFGYRKAARRLVALYWNGKEYTFKTLDDNCGPANAFGYTLDGKDILIATNREVDEVARYEFEAGDL